jgi:subtilisin family serine protease
LGIKVPNCDFLTIIPFNQNHQEQRMIRRRVIGCLLGLLFLTGIHTKAAVAVYVMDNGVRTDHVAFNKIETEVVDMLAGQPAVANLSLGGVPKDPRIEKLVRAINQLVEDGVTVVVAAGNDGVDVMHRIPSTLDSVISVGATSALNSRLISSNYGSCVDIYALGENLAGPGSKSTTHRTRDSGTSISAAVVTGSVAAFLEAQPTAEPNEAKQWLIEKSEVGK